MSVYPKISIITPSFNQGKFIEETILSVIGQGYPNLEYIIMDGGSTDETVSTLKKYDNQISYWVSEPDKGQAHAINKGFDKATGDIIGWLNSDDMFMPGCLFHIAEKFSAIKEEQSLVYGNCLHFKETEEGLTSWGSNVVRASNVFPLEEVDYIIQPSSFWTRKTWEVVGNLREDINFVFDWEWFLRAKSRGIKFYSSSKCLSMYRIHDEHKSGTGGKKRQEEILDLYRTYSARLVDLYKLLMSEDDLRNKKIISRMVKNIFTIMNKQHTDIDILKLSNYSKYKPYTSQEMVHCIAML